MENDESNPEKLEQDGGFAPTHWSLILRAKQGLGAGTAAQDALEWLCRSYWRPVHDLVRRNGLLPEDALDLTQGFFEMLIEKPDFGQVEQSKGKFRSWILGALHHYLLNDARKRHAQKRNSGKMAISLSALQPPDEGGWEPIDAALTPDRAFDRRWALTVLEAAMNRLQRDYEARGAGEQFQHLKPFLAGGVESGNYSKIAEELGVTNNQVAVAVKRFRERFRDRVRSVVAETVAGPEDVDGEMEELFRALRG